MKVCVFGNWFFLVIVKYGFYKIVEISVEKYGSDVKDLFRKIFMWMMD